MKCPICNVRHHPGTLIGFTPFNKNCLKKAMKLGLTKGETT
jgi:hypothetical protein